jgi:hypothetical protein
MVSMHRGIVDVQASFDMLFYSRRISPVKLRCPARVMRLQEKAAISGSFSKDEKLI